MSTKLQRTALGPTNALPPEYDHIPETTPEERRDATKRVLRYSNDPNVAAPLLCQLGLAET